MDQIQNLGDAHEALEECFNVIRLLSEREPGALEIVLRELRCPMVTTKLKAKP
jgi:hypothetical protein